MKLNRNYIQTFVFLLVYLAGIYLWSQPLLERRLPYGEYDAMSHFEVADYISYNDRSFMSLPDYIDIRYGTDNKFRQHVLWYPPPFHTTLAIAETAGGERVLPVFLMNTILASFIVVTLYFVVNSLFGFLPAILSSILIFLSPRDFMPYLWGQWPERFAYAFIPIILYCFYKYYISHSNEEKKPIYIYLTAMFLGLVILIHPLVFFHSIVGLIVLYIFLSIKRKKILFNWKHIAACALIFLALFMMFPYQTFNIFPRFGTGGKSSEPPKGTDFSRLFQWSLNPNDYHGSVPASYFSFGQMHGWWMLPFLLIGLLILLLKREEKDLLMLAWLVSLYLILHRDLFGKAQFLHRSLSASMHIFAPIAAIGAVYAVSLIKIPSNIKTYAKSVLVVAFLYFAFSVNFAYASNLINKNTYNPYHQNGFFSSLNNEEFDAAQWILENVPKSYNISVLGIPREPSDTAKKIRWFAAASQHVTRYYNPDDRQNQIKNFYIVMDYTMAGPLNDKEGFDFMQSFEKNELLNHTRVYDKNNIRVYKLAK